MIKRTVLLSLFFGISSLSYAAERDKNDKPTTTPTTQGGGTKSGGTQTGQTNVEVNKDINCEIQ